MAYVMLHEGREFIDRESYLDMIAQRDHYRAALERVESHGAGYAVKVARETLASERNLGPQGQKDPSA